MTTPEPPSSVRPVDYKGEPLDAERGPGLGCFWTQVGLLVALLVLTPLSVAWGWPFVVSAILLLAVMVLLLFAGQTVIFLLRLVAADRREGTRHRPLASATKTVGELEDEGAGTAPAQDPATALHEPAPTGTDPDPGSDAPAVRE